MAGPNQKVSVLLNGGSDTKSRNELTAPTASQGASITLRESRNTRLTVRPGTCTRAPEETLMGVLDSTCYGMVSCEATRSTVIFPEPGAELARVVPENPSFVAVGSGRLVSPLDPNKAQNCYVPAQISAAGAIPAVAAVIQPVVCHETHTGYIWHAYFGLPYLLGGVEVTPLFMTVTESDGAVIAAPTQVIYVNSADVDPTWLALTYHGASEGIRLWYQQVDVQVARAEIVDRQVEISDITVAFSRYLPVTQHFGVTIISDSTPSNFAYAVYCSADTVIQVDKIDVTIPSVVDTAITAPIFVWNPLLVKQIPGLNFGYTIDGFRLVVSYISENGPNALYMAAIDTSTMTVGTTNTLVGFAYDTANISVQPIKTAFREGTIIAVGAWFDPSTQLYTWRSSGFFNNVPEVLHDTNLRSLGGSITIGSYTYPVFDTYHALEADDSFIPEPSIELRLMVDEYVITPVARYGVPRFTLGPALTYKNASVVTQSLTCFDSSIYATYLKDVVGTSGQVDYSARYVNTSLEPFQPSAANDKDGSALVAAAMPVQWDGVEIAEINGPFRGPKVEVLSVPVGSLPAGSATFTNGDYTVAVVYEWTDASGLLHRSRPLVTNFSIGGGGSAPEVYVSFPDSLKAYNTLLGDLQFSIEAIIYMSEVGPGATLHRMDKKAIHDTAISTDSLVARGFTSEPDVTKQILYSLGTAGQEQVPQPPPPAHDICIAGDRCWIVDAEVRSRIVYSKKRIAGIGFEFSPFYEINLPSGAGRTIAIREWQGSVVAFCERSIFVISGDGPDNLVGNPSGGSFSKPVQVSAYGCTSRESVLVTPKGIVFQSTPEDMYLFTGGEPQLMNGNGSRVGLADDTSEFTVTSSFLLRNQDEAVFTGYASTSGNIFSFYQVWNYALNRWTSWEAPYEGLQALRTHPLAYDRTKVLVLSSRVEGDSILLLDGEQALTGLGVREKKMRWSTDWLLLGGDFMDHVLLRSVFLTAAAPAGVDHDLLVTIETNYGETVSRSWAAAELSGLATAAAYGGKRYVLRMDPVRADTRAVKVTVLESALTAADLPERGIQPISLTFLYAQEAQIHENAMLQGSIK